MPFDIANGPAIYQRMVNKLLNGMDKVKVFAYIDDIMIATNTFEDHLIQLEEVLERMENSGLKIRVDKCEFAQREVQYLGFIVGADGIKPAPKKVEEIADHVFKSPITRRTIR
jgi:ribosomal protein L1